MNLKSVIFQDGREISNKQLGHWTEKDGFNITEESLTREKTKKIYKVVVIPSVSHLRRDMRRWFVFFTLDEIRELQTLSINKCLGQIKANNI